MRGTKVGNVHVQSCRPLSLAAAAQAARRLRHEFRRPARMPAAGGIELAALFQPFEAVTAQGPVPAVGAIPRREQAEPVLEAAR